jgi:hypothetical protein
MNKVSFRERFRLSLIRAVNARYSIPSWLWASSSAFVGLAVMAISFSGDVRGQRFVDALILGRFWGPLVFICSILAMIGMKKVYFRLVRWTAFANFLLWVFGAIAFYLNGGIWNIVIFVGQMLIFWAYKYLASYVRIHHRV